MVKRRNTLYNWLTRRFSIIIRSEENFADKRTFNVNNALLLIFAVVFFTFAVLLTLFLEKKVVNKLIAESDIELLNQKRLVELSVVIDSLQGDIIRKELFIEGLRKVMREDEAGSSEANMPDRARINHEQGKANLDNVSEIDSLFRSEFESGANQMFNFNTVSQYKDEFGSMVFFPPLSGSIVTSQYDVSKKHFGIDLAAGQNEPVKAVADGMVVLSSWTDDAGYVLAVQHKNNLVSLYKHNSVLLKKVGNFVKAGDIIGIIGNSGETSTGPHLHFELWYNGNPLNPAEFVAF